MDTDLWRRVYVCGAFIGIHLVAFLAAAFWLLVAPRGAAWVLGGIFLSCLAVPIADHIADSIFLAANDNDVQGYMDLSCLENSPVLSTMTTAGWTSLPDDLVRRIADSFLATNDVDCYMDLRAICRSWRSATDNPKNSRWDSRFHPRQWIILDEVSESDTRRLLVNTATGRFLRKELPLLRSYYVVATAPGGFFVLAERSPPHAARVFNPLTGDIICFTAPMPLELKVSAAVRFASSTPVLTFFCDSCCKIYTALPRIFYTRDYKPSDYSIFRRFKFAGIDVDVFRKVLGLLSLPNVDPFKLFSSDPPMTGVADDARCFLMEFGGELLSIVINLQGLVQLFKFQAGSHSRVPVKSIGNHAIFIGPHSCLAVDADRFPSVEPGCVYYTEHQCSSARILKCNIKDGKAERIMEAFDFVKRDKQFFLVADRPFTIIQLLSTYTINSPSSQLALQTHDTRRP